MSKYIAETTGEFMLMDLGTGQRIPASRPAVVARSAFIDARVALSQVVKIADVPDEATDADFAEYWATAEGDRDLAIASFQSKFAPEPEADPTPTPAPKPAKRRS